VLAEAKLCSLASLFPSWQWSMSKPMVGVRYQMQNYADVGVTYYVIYNRSTSTSQTQSLEVYRLVNGAYVHNPVSHFGCRRLGWHWQRSGTYRGWVRGGCTGTTREQASLTGRETALTEQELEHERQRTEQAQQQLEHERQRTEQERREKNDRLRERGSTSMTSKYRFCTLIFSLFLRRPNLLKAPHSGS